ncbi:MAG: helix-turn-helix domain-containing protein [Christensenella sp.]|nr:helix-turn-helix domain-containing protein [Christensenella sp.]
MIRKEFILSELNYRYPLVIQTIENPEQSVGRPLLLERDGKISSARIIICRAEELTLPQGADLRKSLYLCIGTPAQEALERLDVCILPENEHRANVLNFVQRLFDRLDDWTLQLRQIAKTGADVKELLQRAASMLQNPVLLFDEHDHVIEHTEALSEDQIVTIANRFCRSEGLPMTESGSFHISGGEGEDALAVSIPVGGARFLLLCVAQERAFYGSDEYVFESLSGNVRMMLSEQKFHTQSQLRRRENAMLEQALRALLEGIPIEADAIKTLEACGWHANDDSIVLAVEPDGVDLRAQRIGAVCELLEKNFSKCCAFPALPIIIAVIRPNTEELAQLRGRLGDLSKSNQLRFGVCEEANGLLLLPQRLSLARRALKRAPALGGVAFFLDTADEYLMDCVTAEFPMELVCLRSVLAMAAYDREHETRYLETAEQYIRNHFNAVKTANALFIHRSTFLYRLERMKEQFSLDLDGEDQSLLHLLLSLKLAETRGEA